jgi:FKBP-type peptidyl-prolyl cis-trans isomerase (trigger factor)
MASALTRLSGSAFELTLTIPWSDVKRIYDLVFDELAAEIEIEGFRKGKAPRNLIEQKIDKGKVYGEVVNRLLPDSYQKALEEHGLHPIVTPQVRIASADEEKEWQFIAQAAEKPQVVLNDYKKPVTAINASGKIWKPGDDDKAKQQDQQKKISEIIDKLLEVCQVELASILTDSETNRLVAQLLDDVRQAGLTFEQYLQSSGQTNESVREKYRKQAETALKLEFILEAIADDLGITVSQEEVQEIIAKETNTEKKKALEAQAYILASVLRRDKTISRLLTL